MTNKLTTELPTASQGHAKSDLTPAIRQQLKEFNERKQKYNLVNTEGKLTWEPKEAST
jgi:hypothetical protein